MLGNTEYSNISIHSCRQEILQTYMLALCAFVTSSLILVYLKVITNIKYYNSRSVFFNGRHN